MKICAIAFESIHTKKYLQWLVNKGHEVHWITCDPKESIPGVKTYDLIHYYQPLKFVGLSILSKMENMRKIFRYIYLLKLLREINPDIFHMHTLYYPSYLGALTFFRPRIISPWNGDVLWTERRPYYYKLFVKWALKNANLITADNEIMKQGLLGYGVNECKIKIIRWYGVDTKVFYPQDKDENLLEELNITNQRVVVSMRSIGAMYNIDKIIKSIPKVLERINDVIYVFGWFCAPLENEMRVLAKDLGVDDKIRFVGRIPNEKLPRYYNIADIGISIASPDSTPATLFEAMACGLPMVVSKEKAITEFILDGQNGEVVDPKDVNKIADRTVELLTHNEKREKYKMRNLAIVKQKADLDVEMQKMEELYYKIVEVKK